MRKIVILFEILMLTSLACVLAVAQDKTLTVESVLDRVESRQTFNGLIEVSHGNPAVENVVKETVDALDVQDKPLEDVLASIKKQTGMVFIFPEPTKDRISLSVEKINVWDLLKIILQAHGLAYYQTNGAVHIMREQVFEERYGNRFAASLPSAIVPIWHAQMEPVITLVKVAKSPEGKIWADVKNRQILMIDTPEKIEELRALISRQDVYLTTREFILQYVSYGAVREELARLLTKDIGRVEFRAGEKKIVVTDSEAKLNAIELFLKEKDRKTIMPFRVKIARVLLNEEHSEGIDWEAIVSDYQVCVLNPSDEAAVAGEKLHIGTLTKEDYEILIDALDAVGEITPLIVFDFEPALNQEKSLDLDTNDPFWSLRPDIRQSQNEPVILDPNGFEMQVLFSLNKSGDQLYFEMLPRLHWMDDDGMSEEDKQRVFISQEKKRLDFNQGDAVVIGGLIRTEAITRTRKFPLLGDLPVVGSVFRMERRRFTSREYIIFLLPNGK